MEKTVIKIRQKSLSLKDRIWNLAMRYRYVSGITVIELVLILVIVIALLLIFKNQLISLINSIFDKITSESSSI